MVPRRPGAATRAERGSSAKDGPASNPAPAGDTPLGYQAPADCAAARTDPRPTLTYCGTYVTCYTSAAAVANRGRPLGR